VGFGVLCGCVAVDCSVTVVCLGYAFVRGLPAGSVLCSAFGSNIFFFAWEAERAYDPVAWEAPAPISS